MVYNMQVHILLDCFPGITYMNALLRSSISGLQKNMHLLTDCTPSLSFSEHQMRLASISTFSWKPMSSQQFADTRD
ncbi:hypothetical protein T11_16039 [Trichinella zimbabwensis]|uniref:Uncharacterized protein n=1 Tax=Trichinella zimbabwensis TaxID=268475 RepID=A0A0V1GS93_9BILA|nr:hypothetical protein T11_16039 [Trichinella zimbabwensis]